MQAIVQRSYGPPDGLTLEEIERPAVGDDQVLIRIRAASLNAYDWHMLRGKPYLARLVGGLRKPKRQVPGVDLAGVIEAVGPNVTRLHPGDEVFGPSNGALAEYAAAGQANYALKPPTITFEEAAAVPMAATTALQGLRDHGRVEPGQKVLIVGASGGVGTFAVQIAKALGAEVTAVCSTGNVDAARLIGADRVVDYTREDLAAMGERHDLILVIAGDRRLSDYRRVLGPAGRLVFIGGATGGNWVGPLIAVLKPRLASLFRGQKMATMLAKNRAADLEFVAALMEAGKVTPVIDRRYPLAEAPEALRYLGAGHARGKIVITV
ncbi:MAG: NAD(P)-dependent alcohol dehydrogenase [Actinobacteria bacterium]|nr:NAD(P)-dependent alcohol dehydrogenase [Actinomycetota bacterium]MBU1492827.1 NAD(P)-dependent alcohol dehydrogenase [Actinomycetota bacterium]MBU1866744.1 NAD(P)-dependent alcohol dehydrogenase [Actinomycetota bacterium]